MKTDKICLVAVGLIVAILAPACGPAQADLNATATRTAADMSATQTAQAPTATPTFTPTPTPRPTSTPTPTPTPPSPRALLESSLAALQDANTYHFDMDMQMKSHAQPATTDVSITLTGDFQAPDRMQAEMSTSAAGTSNKTEMIIISQTTYLVNPATGNWEIARNPVAFRPDMFTTGELKGVEDLKFVGEENLDGTPVYHLALASPMDVAGLLEGEMLIEYWIGSEDVLPRQISSHGDLAATALGTTSTLTITMQLSDFGKKVAIEAPPLPTPTPTATPRPALKITPAADLSAVKITLADLPATFDEFPQPELAKELEASLAQAFTQDGGSAKVANVSAYAVTDAKNPQVFMSFVLYPLDKDATASFDAAMGQSDLMLQAIAGRMTGQSGKAKVAPLKGSDQLGDNSIGGTVVGDKMQANVIIMRRGAALSFVLLFYNAAAKPGADVVKLATTLDQRLQDALK